MNRPVAHLDHARSLVLTLALPVSAAALLHVGLLFLYLLPTGCDLSALVCVEAGKVRSWPYEAVRIGFPRNGYDGQFYYLIARWPVAPPPAFLDDPGVRHSRILYPGLAWLVSGGGDPERLLWALPLVNVLACAGLALVGTLIALYFGRSPWWGFWLPLVVNAGFASLRNLTDPVATLAVAGLLAAYLLRWPAWSLGLWATAALLAREQNLAIVLLVLGGALWQRREIILPLLLGLGVWLAWILTLRCWYGVWPFATGTLAWPLRGLAHVCTTARQQTGLTQAVCFFGLLHLGVQVLLIAALPLLRTQTLTVAVAVAGTVLITAAGPPIYSGPWSLARVFAWVPLALWLGSVESGRRWPILLLLPTLIWPTAAVAQMWWR